MLASKSVIDFEIGSIDLKCQALFLAADLQQGEEAVDPEVQHKPPSQKRQKPDGSIHGNASKGKRER